MPTSEVGLLDEYKVSRCTREEVNCVDQKELDGVDTKGLSELDGKRLRSNHSGSGYSEHRSTTTQGK